jgi:hypothetical protein
MNHLQAISSAPCAPLERAIIGASATFRGRERRVSDNELVSLAHILRRSTPGFFYTRKLPGPGLAECLSFRPRCPASTIGLWESGRNLPRRCLVEAETDFRNLSVFWHEFPRVDIRRALGCSERSVYRWKI